MAPGKAVFALVDNDREGRELYKNSKLAEGGVWKQDNSNKVYWCRLSYIDELKTLMNQCKVDAAFWPGCLENIFTADLKRKAVAAGVLSFTKSPHSEFLGEHYGKIVDFLSERNDYLHSHILAPEPSSKETFANWIVLQADENPEILEPPRKVMTGLRDILSSINSASS